MNEREMLELAEKAAGIRIDKSETNGGGKGNTGFDVLGNAVLDWHNGKKWNPLTNPADRYELAKELMMTVDFDWRLVTVKHDPMDGSCPTITHIHWPEDEPDDAHAIVRVAAEVGRAMK